MRACGTPKLGIQPGPPRALKIPRRPKVDSIRSPTPLFPPNPIHQPQPQPHHATFRLFLPPSSVPAPARFGVGVGSLLGAGFGLGVGVGWGSRLGVGPGRGVEVREVVGRGVGLGRGLGRGVGFVLGLSLGDGGGAGVEIEADVSDSSSSSILTSPSPPSLSLSSPLSSFILLDRLRDVEAGDRSWRWGHRIRRQETSLSSQIVESARKRARLGSVCSM